MISKPSTALPDLSPNAQVPEKTLLPIAPGQSIRLCLRNPSQVPRDWVTFLATPAAEKVNFSQNSLAVSFLNMRYFMAARQRADAMSAFASMDRVLPDGVGIQMAGWLFGLPRFARVSGTDTVPELLAQLPPGTRVFLLGGPPSAQARLRDAFATLFPSLVLAGTHHGFFEIDDEAHLAQQITSAQADVLLVGMGSPVQELWVQRNRHRVNSRLVICVGGLFQYWVGDLRRAPSLARALGFEWLWILVQQPEKWRIFSVDAVRFALILLRLRAAANSVAAAGVSTK